MMMDSVIQFEGTIYEDGYGLLAQRVMRDKSLPKQSKLIYAYMCSFASVGKNGERSAFPSVSLQCAEIGMSEDTYYKWRKPLIDKGYIKIKKQRQEGAKFDNNIYSIIAVPVEVKDDETVDIKAKKPTPKKSGMEKKQNKPYPKNPSTENPSTEKSGTNINTFNINSFNKDEEEEEEMVTLDNIILFINKQINKREITNPKTITAILEVADKCRAIGTSDIEAMENYCIRVVEDKMSKLGQKQRQKSTNTKKANTTKPTRKEMKPNWLDKENTSESTPVTVQSVKQASEMTEMTKEEFELEKKKLFDRIKKYKEAK